MPRSNITFYQWCLKSGNSDLLNHLVDLDDANKYSFSSHSKVRWRCDNGHVFETDFGKFTNPYRSYTKTAGRFSCPVCSGQLCVKGINDLATTHPDIANEFDIIKNDGLQATDITAGSRKMIWWRCSLGHSWQARVSARTYGNGCPFCSNRRQTSIREKFVYYYVRKYFNDAVSNVSVFGVNVDIFVPSLSVAIEYDGSVWHQSKDTSYKFEALASNGVVLYVISGIGNDCRKNVISFDDRYDHDYSGIVRCIGVLLGYFGISESFADFNDAMIFAKSEYYDSINKVVRRLPKEFRSAWSPLNGYSFDLIQNDSVDKLWRCENGHTYTRRLDVAIKFGLKCPYCLSKRYFDLVCLCEYNNAFILFDCDTGEFELASKQDCLDASACGVNIGAISCRDSSVCMYMQFYEKMGSILFNRYFGAQLLDKAFTNDVRLVDIVARFKKVFSEIDYYRFRENYSRTIRSILMGASK